MNQAQSLLAFGIILATCIAGIIGVSHWAIGLGAPLLALCSATDPNATFHRNGISGATSPSADLVALALNASAAAAAAFLLGRSIGWVWGV